MSEFRLGDKVKVIHAGHQYTTAQEYADKMKLKKYTSRSCINGNVGYITGILGHFNIVGIIIDYHEYIIEERGLRMIKKLVDKE